MDRLDQLSALSLALAAPGVLRRHQIRAADIDRERTDPAGDVPLAWATYRFVEMPIRFGKPSPRRIAAVCAAMVLVALAGAPLFLGAASISGCRRKSAPSPVCHVRVRLALRQCLLDLSQEMSFADDCADRNRRPLVLVWGDSTAAALIPGLRHAQETRNFGVAQFTPAPAFRRQCRHRRNPNCRASTTRCLSIVRDLRPDVVRAARHLAGLRGQGRQDRHHVQANRRPRGRAGRRAMLAARITHEVLRYYMLRHGLIPIHFKGDLAYQAGWTTCCAKDSCRWALNSFRRGMRFATPRAA